ncbi:MAG: uroporphyrinogen-III synthase [Pseudomonadota bacterium]
MSRVIITRPLPDAESFAADCLAKNHEPFLAPLMEITFFDRPAPLETIGALAFTSVNGVRAFVRQSKRRDLRVFAVGETTAAAAEAENFAHVFAAGGDVESLAEIILNSRKLIEGAVLHIAGEHRAGDLVGLLTAKGLEASRYSAYCAEAAAKLPASAANAIAEKTPCDITFFSPRTATLFMKLVENAGLMEQLSRHRALCLSENVAKALSSAPWKDIRIAAARNSAAMVSLMSESA